SWGYWIDNGATSLWERWDLGARSRDHAFLGGAIDDWFFKDLAGLRPAAAGWERIEVRPEPVGDLRDAGAETMTPYGRMASKWERDRDGDLELDVTVPVGATAEVHVPADSFRDVDADHARYIGVRDGRPAFAVGSGTYEFEVKARRGYVDATGLRVNALEDPVGIDDATPSLSWRLSSRVRDQAQSAYQVRIESGGRTIWDSGRVRSADSVNVPYGGPPLESRQRLEWSVRVWDEHGGVSKWARPARFEMGLLERADWQANWVADPAMEEKPTEPLVIEFPAREARYLRLDVTRLGLPLKEGWPDPVSRLQLSELEAYGGGELRSRGAAATASESYTVGGVWEPRFLTDGTRDSNTDPRGYTSYERFEQDLDEPIWLEIDLGEVTSVDEVRLYPRTDTLTPERRTANFPEDFALQTRTDGSWTEAHRVEGQAAPQPPEPPPALPLLSRGFELDGHVRSARLYAAGLGVYEATLNGRRVGDAVLEPGNTDYRKRVEYSTYDVTEELRRGANTLEFALGRGIYDVPGGTGRYTKFTGSMGPLKLLAQLEVTYADGRREVIATDPSWRAESGPTTFTNWYGGEDYDARREGGDGEQRPVQQLGAPDGEPVLSARSAPPVRVQETISARSREEVAPSVWLYDLGRNMAGWPEVTVRGAAGKTVRLTPGEKTADGRVTQAEIGGPVYFDYTAATDRAETWHPRFMYYGFRYVEVSGLDEPLPLADVRAKVLRADNERAGDIEFSDETLNRVHDMVLAAVESNMFSVLTDCPHREKLGWLEEYHLLYDTVAANFDVSAYYGKLSRDIRDAQLENGMVPDIAPEYTVFSGGFRDDANWGGAVIMVPWKHYRAYGDADLLRDGFGAMERYMAYLASRADDHVLSHGLGDWGAFDTSTPLAIPATTAYYRFAEAMAEIAHVVGEEGKAAGYRELAASIRESFNERFLDEDAGSYGSGSQASNALPLAAGMVPAEHRDAVVAALRADIAERGDHLSTGEIGLRALFDVLGEAGDAETVLAMAKNPTAPSYAAMLASGATTLPEFWDGRGSQNHFMMGAIDDWSYRYLAGIRPTAPGFRTFLVAPLVPDDLDHVRASWESPYGTIRSAWRKRGGGRLELDVTVPVNTTAEVRVPGDGEVRLDGRVVGSGEGVVLELGSGEYEIESRPG
ncbi:MAG TPA: family 78 glycoside hydrolase catalytic domain, partial [Solirubrobacteraceae bacterium]|nr:family 78 glycoside hydrolase catalytic domain [Solirubrobacteraceae bacterium]